MLLAVFIIFRYINCSMEAAEVIRKLSGMRMAVTFFRLAKGRQPADIGEAIQNGNLEAVPQIKLNWHLASSKVRKAAELIVRDTGGWGYVNNPASRDFGTIFIDCAHKDPKGRYWSEF